MPSTNYSSNAGREVSGFPKMPPPPMPPVADQPVTHESAPSYYEPPPPNFYEELSLGKPAANLEFQTSSPIPPVCIKCGSEEDVKIRDFIKSYTPRWAYLSLLLGPIPAILIMMSLQKQHKLKGMFCPPCNSNYTRGVLLYAGSALLFLVTFIGGLYLASKSITPYAGLAILTVGALASMALSIWSRRYAPKYGKVTRKQVFVQIPNFGDVEFTNSAK